MTSVDESDAFEAVASPQRRRMLDVLAEGERSVNELVAVSRLRQPLVSKHLRVLRQANLIRVRQLGRRRLYHIHGPGMKQLNDWTGGFARFWEHQLDAIKARAEAAAAKLADRKGATS